MPYYAQYNLSSFLMLVVVTEINHNFLKLVWSVISCLNFWFLFDRIYQKEYPVKRWQTLILAVSFFLKFINYSSILRRFHVQVFFVKILGPANDFQIISWLKSQVQEFRGWGQGVLVVPLPGRKNRLGERFAWRVAGNYKLLELRKYGFSLSNQNIAIIVYLNFFRLVVVND